MKYSEPIGNSNRLPEEISSFINLMIYQIDIKKRGAPVDCRAQHVFSQTDDSLATEPTVPAL